jgi:hypothetical protein
MRAEEINPGTRYWLASTPEPFEAYRVSGRRVDGFMKSGRRRYVDASDIGKPLGHISCVNDCGIFDADRSVCPACGRPVDPALRSTWPG